MKKALGIPMLLIGLLVAVAGVYAISRGLDARHTVTAALQAEEITTPDQASIPGARVDDAATAQSMVDFIDEALEGPTAGRSYTEIGRFLTADGKDTNDAAAAAVGADGMPTENPLRQIAFEASTAKTSLTLSVMAFSMTDIAVGLGALMLVVSVVLVGGGVAMVGVPVPALARRRPATEAPAEVAVTA